MKILICDDDIYFAQCIYKFLQQIESEQNLLLEIQSFNNTEALLDVVKTDSEIKLIFLDIIFTGFVCYSRVSNEYSRIFNETYRI